MEEFFQATSTDIGPSQERLSMWQRIEAHNSGEEAVWFKLAGYLRYPDNENELNAAFSLKATDSLAANGA